MLNKLKSDGFVIAPQIFGCQFVEGLAQEIDTTYPTISAAGIRGLAQKVKSIRTLAQSSEIRKLVESDLGINGRLVRSIYFNKSADINWQVAWHQDLTIAVQEKLEIEGYRSWSLKEGVPHVHPPLHVLERMLTVRVHLDFADESNGALWVAPGSHRLGKISSSDASNIATRFGKHLCSVNAGDVMLFKPLILHASYKAASTHKRRVIHFEFANVDLPSPLRWSEVA